jgi:sorting nexin-1/2
VTGVDDEGEFSAVRRYREFHALATALKTRWPGCYVPQIPEKKMMNQTNEAFVEERR